MATGFTLTDDDAGPEGASVLEDAAELSLLTASGTTSDLTWPDGPPEL